MSPIVPKTFSRFLPQHMIQNSAVKNHSQHIMECVFRGCPGDSRDVWYYDSRTGRRGVIVTSGKFTSEAKKCAHGKSIKLVDGPCLLELVKQVQNRVPTSNNQTSATTELDKTQFCPVCGRVMVPRTARRGQNAGNKFWGCPDYPGCKGTRQL